MNQIVEKQNKLLQVKDESSEKPENHSSRANLVKPSMMSVEESVNHEEGDGAEAKKPLKSTMLATLSGVSQASICIGKTVHNLNYRNISKSTINSVATHVEAMPMPKKFQIAKKKAEREEKKAKLEAEKAERAAAEAAGIKLPKKAKVSKFAFPTPDPLPPPKPLTVAEAMKDAKSWNAAKVIDNKFSVGTLTTSNFAEKTKVFMEMNPLAEQKGSLYPQAAFFGKDPSQSADVFCQRKVKALNDISFEEDSEWEEVKNLKRMPRTVINEENLREYLSEETLRLNLENHYWIKNNMIEKIGRMAPNIMHLSLRRMKFITNPVFAEIFKYMHSLVRIDLTDCLGLLPTACNLLIDHNRQLSHV